MDLDPSVDLDDADPSAAKAAIFMALNGTTEVVPFPFLLAARFSGASEVAPFPVAALRARSLATPEGRLRS